MTEGWTFPHRRREQGKAGERTNDLCPACKGKGPDVDAVRSRARRQAQQDRADQERARVQRRRDALFGPARVGQ